MVVGFFLICKRVRTGRTTKKRDDNAIMRAASEMDLLTGVLRQNLDGLA